MFTRAYYNEKLHTKYWKLYCSLIMAESISELDLLFSRINCLRLRRFFILFIQCYQCLVRYSISGKMIGE
jgi:hypothetical protein